jgi:hypothetical protein
MVMKKLKDFEINSLITLREFYRQKFKHVMCETYKWLDKTKLLTALAKLVEENDKKILIVVEDYKNLIKLKNSIAFAELDFYHIKPKRELVPNEDIFIIHVDTLKIFIDEHWKNIFKSVNIFAFHENEDFAFEYLREIGLIKDKFTLRFFDKSKELTQNAYNENKIIELISDKKLMKQLTLEELNKYYQNKGFKETWLWRQLWYKGGEVMLEEFAKRYAWFDKSLKAAKKYCKKYVKN